MATIYTTIQCCCLAVLITVFPVTIEFTSRFYQSNSQVGALLIDTQIDCIDSTMCFNKSGTIQYTRHELLKYNPGPSTARLGQGDWSVIKSLA
jgi:hypothetical protein